MFRPSRAAAPFAVLALLAATLAGCSTLPADPAAGRTASAVAPAEVRAPVTILVSIDGFRPDYLARGNTPRLDALAGAGVNATMRPSFPSKTFPNHWTIVTGDRPDRHGIVANKMEDSRRPGEIFTMASDDPFWWNDAPPIWVDAEKAGIRTATMFWPGANVAWGGTRAAAWPDPISGGTRPQDWQQFNQVVSGTQRVNAVLDWLRRPADIRPAFVTLYFDTVDTAGHVAGPNTAETDAAVADVDRSIGMLIDGLRTLGQPANLVIVSDHGMAETSSDRVIALDRIAPPTDYHIIESGPYASLEPMPGKEDALAKVLLGHHEHMDCWRKADIPARFHYGTNPRIPSFFCLAQTRWSILPTAPSAAFRSGNHGFDNMSPDMAALFIANGPAFRSGTTLPAFDNVDVYPLLARLIGIASGPSDGKTGTFDAVLVKAPPRP